MEADRDGERPGSDTTSLAIAVAFADLLAFLPLVVVLWILNVAYFGFGPTETGGLQWMGYLAIAMPVGAAAEVPLNP